MICIDWWARLIDSNWIINAKWLNGWHLQIASMRLTDAIELYWLLVLVLIACLCRSRNRCKWITPRCSREIEELRHECHQLMGLLSSHEAICKQTTSIQYHNNSNYSNYFHTFDQNNNDIRHTQPNANSQCTDSYTNNSYYFNSNNNLNMNSIW